MEKFLEKFNIPKLIQEYSESLNRQITEGEIEAVMKKLLQYKSPGLDGFIGEFYKTFKEELTNILLKLPQKNARREKTPKLLS